LGSWWNTKFTEFYSENGIFERRRAHFLGSLVHK